MNIEFENITSWDMNKLRKSYDKDGFVLGGKFLTDSSIDFLINEIDYFLNKNENACKRIGMATDEVILQYIDLWKKIDAVADILRSTVLKKILTALCDETELRIYHDQLQYKPAKIGGVNCWHQDVEFWPFLQPYTEITAWIALDDVNEENGCMRMVPGSHQWGEAEGYLKSLENYLPLPNAYRDHEISPHSCIVPKGHIHFHHHLTWHGSGLNLSHLPRRALAFHIFGGKTYYCPKNIYKLKRYKRNQIINGEELPLIGTRFDPWPVIESRLTEYCD